MLSTTFKPSNMWLEWPSVVTAAGWAHPTCHVSQKTHRRKTFAAPIAHKHTPVEEVSFLQLLTSPALLSVSDVRRRRKRRTEPSVSKDEEQTAAARAESAFWDVKSAAAPLQTPTVSSLGFLPPSSSHPASCHRTESQPKACKCMDCKGSEGKTTR